MDRPPLLNSCARVLALLIAFAALLAFAARAQGNYEVQVYGSDLVKPGTTMVEIHSNFTFQGSKTITGGVRPTEHAVHETLEITQGFTPWLETGFYIFTSVRAGEGWQYVGSHIRPRVAIPQEWKWPVGLSLSAEVGYQRRSYSTDTWTLEVRPIVDKQAGRWYLCFNPVFDRSFHGSEVPRGVTFSPNVKASYDVTKKVKFGFEYYGSLGSVRGFDPIRDQQHALLAALDIDFGENWEFNIAAGPGLTAGTDHMLAKMIVGRRFNFHKK